jgi:hypothetical protein
MPRDSLSGAMPLVVKLAITKAMTARPRTNVSGEGRVSRGGSACSVIKVSEFASSSWEEGASSTILPPPMAITRSAKDSAW